MIHKTKQILSKGFTLIELLVVIAIIGMLSAVIIVSLNSARNKSRDTRRISDVRQIITAMELYYNDNSAYPDQAASPGDPTPASVGVTGSTSTEFRDYLLVWPTAPSPADGTCAAGAASTITTSTNQYTYWGRDAADSANDTSDPAFYQVTFCLGAPSGGFAAGEWKGTPSGIVAN